jgi:uncharacterized RDD family membrane protein YckC
VNTICSQCGSVLASGVHVCSFCDSSADLPLHEGSSSTRENSEQASGAAHEAWRGELNQRLQAYRARKRKTSLSANQSALPFEDHASSAPRQVAVQVEESASAAQSQADDFAFSIGIGRIAQKEADDPRVLIDVSNRPNAEDQNSVCVSESPVVTAPTNLLPVASIDHRRRALLADAACLAFAYGGFLALFASLGGQFTLSKLSAAVCVFTFAFVYLQYFGLFTIFGGSTPGMMLCGLQVASSTGDMPSPRQYLLRAAGYVLSAGTCFLGFLWVLWDDEGLTWHDRISRTYLTSVETFEEEVSEPVGAR